MTSADGFPLPFTVQTLKRAIESWTPSSAPRNTAGLPHESVVVVAACMEAGAKDDVVDPQLQKIARARMPTKRVKVFIVRFWIAMIGASFSPWCWLGRLEC